MLDEYVTQAHRYLWFERIDLEVSLRNRYHRCKNVRLSFAILHNAEDGPLLLSRQDRGDAKAEVKSKRGLGTLSLKLAYTSTSAGLRKRF